MAGVVGGGTDGRRRRGRGAVPVPAPRDALGGRRARGPRGRGARRRRRRGHRELRGRRVRRRSPGCDAHPGLDRVLDHALRARRPYADGRRPSSSCRPSRAVSSAAVGARRPVPGRRAHQRVAGGHVLGHGGRGGGPARGATGSRRAHRLLDRRGDDDRGEQLRASTSHAASAARRSRRRRGTIETPSIEPTLDGYVGFCTNSREQFHSFLLLIERPDLMRRRVRGAARRTGRSAGTSGTRSSTRGRRSTPPRRSCAWRASCASRSRRCTAARTSSSATTSSPAGCSSTTPTGTFKMPRRPWRMDDEDPPPPRPSPRLGEHTGAIEPHTPARPGDPPPPRRCRSPGCACSTSPRGGRGRSPPDMLAALGADVIHVESISRIDGMRATGGQHRHGRRVVGAQPALPRARTRTSAASRSTSGPRTGSRCCATHREERRGARELLARACSATSGSEWDAIQADQPARACSCACPRSGCRVRGATTSGFAQTMEQVTGLAWITGLPDDQPRIQQGPSDPNAGMHAAFALIVGLARARGHRAAAASR